MIILGVSKISKVSVILPRSQLTLAMEKLFQFETFHAQQSDSSQYDELLDDYSKRSLRIYVKLSELVKELKLKPLPGILDTLKDGYNISAEKFELNKWEDILSILETQTDPVITSISDKINNLKDFNNQISKDETNLEALKLLSNFSINLENINKLNYFSISLNICNNADIEEISKSFSDAIISTDSLTDDKSLILVAVKKEKSETIEKTLRMFEVDNVIIPDELPQNPFDAHKLILENLNVKKSKLDEINADILTLVKQHSNLILSHFELSKILYDSCELVKRTGDLKFFAIITGFIPSSRKKQFEDEFNNWILLSEEINPNDHHNESHSEAPTLLKNPSITNSFEFITLNQGQPKYGEIDPTLLITLSFPIFYGMMFGDVGHGLILFLSGLFLLYRKAPFLKKWGQIFTLSGIAAIFFGFLIGEFFGIEIYSLTHLFGHAPIHFIHRGHGLSTVNVVALKYFLKISILMGITHLFIGNFITIYNTIKNKEYDELIIEKIPVFLMFFGFVFLMFAFIGTSFKIDQLFVSQHDTPIFFFLRAFPISLVSIYSISILLFGFLIFIIGKPIMILTGKVPKESIIMVAFVSFLDGGIEKIAGSLSNILSYSRLAVLLTVHSSLLIVVNLVWGFPLFLAIPLVILLNILVLVLEGMIVYIQSLRLHLYEWFTKFFVGSGNSFQALIPKLIRTKLIWKD